MKLSKDLNIICPFFFPHVHDNIITTYTTIFLNIVVYEQPHFFLLREINGLYGIVQRIYFVKLSQQLASSQDLDGDQLALSSLKKLKTD